MKSRRLTRIIAMTLFALAIPVAVAAQDNAAPNHKAKHHHYQLFDMGTLGRANFSTPLCGAEYVWRHCPIRPRSLKQPNLSGAGGQRLHHRAEGLERGKGERLPEVTEHVLRCSSGRRLRRFPHRV